jgi:hypothetical protein
MKTATKTKTKGFGTTKKPAHYQTFSCECLWHNKDTDEEELVELWNIKIDIDRFNLGELRKSIAMGLIYCFLESEEAVKRGINRIFIWNNKSRAYEPLGAVSDAPMTGSSPVDFEADPVVAFERLKALCVEIEIIKVDSYTG